MRPSTPDEPETELGPSVPPPRIITPPLPTLPAPPHIQAPNQPPILPIIQQPPQQPPPQRLPPAIMAALTPNNMPYSVERGAPPEFKGGALQVVQFLKVFERLACDHNLSLLQAKRHILRYCDYEQADFIENMPTYIAIRTEVAAPNNTGNIAAQHPPFRDQQWTNFTRELKRIYGASSLEQNRFKEQDLVAFAEGTRKEVIETMDDFHNYERRFGQIGSWLFARNKIAEEKLRFLFFTGLPMALRDKIHFRIMLADPTTDETVPFPIDRVVAAAHKVLSRERFDEIAPRTTGPRSVPQDFRPPVKTEELDEEEWRRRRALDARSKTVRFDSPTPKPALSDQGLLEELITRFSKLPIGDESVYTVYAQLSRLNPGLAADLLKLKMHSTEASQPRPRTPPPTQRSLFSTRPHSDGCFFCADPNHNIKICPTRQEMLDKGILSIRDDRTFWADGTPIEKRPNETLLEAVLRGQDMARKSRALINYIPSYDCGEESETEDSAEVLAGPKPAGPYGVKRKVFDGVRILRKDVGASREPAEKGKAGSQSQIPSQVPFDPPSAEPPKKQQTNPNPGNSAIRQATRPLLPAGPFNRKSNNQILEGLADRFGATTIKLSLSEAVAVIPDFLTFVGSAARPIAKPASILAEPLEEESIIEIDSTIARINNVFSYGTDIKERLPRIQTTIAGFTYLAIVDSGSELNLMDEPIWSRSMLPIDRQGKIRMGDVNGGSMRSKGLVPSITVKIGEIETVGSFFVGNFPFHILLGRPWIRMNRVDMIERDEGSVIVIKNCLNDPDCYYEIMAIPDREYHHHHYCPKPWERPRKTEIEDSKEGSTHFLRGSNGTPLPRKTISYTINDLYEKGLTDNSDTTSRPDHSEEGEKDDEEDYMAVWRAIVRGGSSFHKEK